MKKKLLMLAVAIALPSCDGGAAYSKMKCRESVMNDPDVLDSAQTETSKYEFYVRKKDGSVWIYKCLSPITPDVTERILVFPALNQPPHAL